MDYGLFLEMDYGPNSPVRKPPPGTSLTELAANSAGQLAVNECVALSSSPHGFLNERANLQCIKDSLSSHLFFSSV